MNSPTPTGTKRRLIQTIRAQAMVIVPAIALIIGGFVLAWQFVEPAAPAKLVMSTGSKSGAYYAFGRRYKDYFASQGVELELQNSAGSIENLGRLQRGEETKVAFMQGGIGGAKSNPTLKALGSIYYEPIWVFVRNNPKAGRLTELKGKRIAVGALGSGTRAVAMQLLRDNGLNDSTATLKDLGSADATKGLISGNLDAAIIVTSVNSTTVKKLMAIPGISLMSFDRAEAYLRRTNFLSRVVLPEGTIDLAANYPPRDTVLLAPAATIVISDKMHPALIDLMLLAMHDIHRAGGHLEGLNEFPSAEYVSFPLEPTAQRFIERGPPLLQRYLPFQWANLLDRLKVMILPLLTILYPLIKILPPIYGWRMRARVTRWYKELQQLDDGIKDGTVSIVDATQRLNEVEDAVENISVPVDIVADAYTLRLHIDYLRRKLEATHPA
jgi:TRAP transporter TAXI family solute receptor